MLNKLGERELAYVVRIDDVKPIAGRDRVECAVVGGWTVMVRKDQFRPGDLGIYFEIDSKCPEKEPFMFLEGKHFKIKTQKYKTPDGPFFSQGLLMSAEDFGWEALTEGAFLTKELGVTYADAADNARKAKSDPDAKYKKMMSRHPKLAKSAFGKWCMRHTWAKKLLYLLLGRKSDKKMQFPDWVVKTDEERIQNLVGRIPEFRTEKWIATEKIDGTSTTFTMKRGKGKKVDFRVCSRNVVMNQPGKDKTCYYANTDGNVYVEMAEKYDMYNVLKDMLDKNPSCNFITIQGETYGGSIQKRDYAMKEHDLAVFNVIFGYKDGKVERLNPNTGKEFMDKYNIPYVPIIGEIELPETCADILALAGGASAIDGGMREGLVFRTLDGARSFKAVDNEFLAKYHA